jgi:hypothetical protein
MRRLLPLFLLTALTLVPVRADALTVRDVVELSRAGLGEDVLLALIEVDPSVFAIDTATLKLLKEAGVSQRVIVAMIRSARMPTPPPPDPVQAMDFGPVAPPPQVVVIERPDPVVREVAVPVYIPVGRTGDQDRRFFSDHRFVDQTNPGRFIPSTGLSAPVYANAPAFWGSTITVRPEDVKRAPRVPETKPDPKPDRKPDRK